MSGWTRARLEDALVAAAPFDAVRARAAGMPGCATVLGRLESAGVHCQAVAYFSPEAAALGRAFGAIPCAAPSGTGLVRISGRSP